MSWQCEGILSTLPLTNTHYIHSLRQRKSCTHNTTLCSVSKWHFLLLGQVLTGFMHMIFYREVGWKSKITIWTRLLFNLIWAFFQFSTRQFCSILRHTGQIQKDETFPPTDNTNMFITVSKWTKSKNAGNSIHSDTTNHGDYTALTDKMMAKATRQCYIYIIMSFEIQLNPFLLTTLSLWTSSHWNTGQFLFYWNKTI